MRIICFLTIFMVVCSAGHARIVATSKPANLKVPGNQRILPQPDPFAKEGTGITLHVPLDYPTIQDAIDHAVSGNRVIVHPGTYRENIDFMGKAIEVKSLEGPAATVINGTKSGSTVTFSSNEGPDTALEGFSIINGSGTPYLPFGNCGGGVFCVDASPRIMNNIIRGNSVVDPGNRRFSRENTGVGGGIFCLNSQALIQNNLIYQNFADMKGGGLACGDSILTLNNCTVANNNAGTGGGFYVSNASTLFISNSIFWDNTATTVPEILIRVASHLTIEYSDIEGGESGVKVSPDCVMDWGAGMIDEDPLFVQGPKGHGYLSQLDAGQSIESPCVDAGDPSLLHLVGTTRTDEIIDLWPLDMGYHHVIY
jgi:hypothetical protein